MKPVNAIMKSDTIFQRHEVDGEKIDTVYRTVKIGEEVECDIYSEQNYFLGTPYYNSRTRDGFNCCVNIENLQIIEAK